MKLLLDSHALLWAAKEIELSPQADQAIKDSGNVVFVSMISLWEIRIKECLKKISVPIQIYSKLNDVGYEILNLSLKHIDALGSLPMHHRDPFDRMLIAQAKVEGLTLITRDPQFELYGINLLKA